MSAQSAVANESGVDGLEDLSGRVRALRFQGPRVLAWLSSQGIACPEALFATRRQGAGADAVLVARVGSGDVILQGSRENQTLETLGRAIASAGPGVFQIPEQATTLRLAGAAGEKVWPQTCALPLATQPVDTVVYTRVAGVSCAVIPEQPSGARSYRIWVDYSYAAEVWRSFAAILSS